MLFSEDPDDRAIREAHGIGYEVSCDDNVECFNGCGLSYPYISAGKVRVCSAVAKPDMEQANSPQVVAGDGSAGSVD